MILLLTRDKIIISSVLCYNFYFNRLYSGCHSWSQMGSSLERLPKIGSIMCFKKWSQMGSSLECLPKIGSIMCFKKLFYQLIFIYMYFCVINL